MIADWLNENAYRAFPFVEDSSGACTDGTTMPDWLVRDVTAVTLPWWRSDLVPSSFVDLVSFRVNSPSGGRSHGDVSLRFRMNAVLAEDDERSLELDLGGSHGTLIVDYRTGGVAYVSYGRREEIYLEEGELREADIFLKAAIGAPADWSSVDPGFYDVEHVLVEPRPVLRSRCIYRPGGFGVQGFITDSDSHTPNTPHKVMLVDGNNTTLRIQGGRIVLDIADGIGEGRSCAQPDSSMVGIYMINGQHADSDGTFTIYAGQGIDVSSGTYDSHLLGEVPAIVVSTNAVVDSYSGG